MSSYCSVVMIGRAGGPPEERQTNGGKRLCTFRLAVNRLEGPQKQAVADWFTVVCFDATAESALRGVQKGDMVLVDGRLQARQFETADGRPQQRVEIVAGRVRVLQRNAPREEVAGAAPGGGLEVRLNGAPSTSWELEPAIPF